MKQIREIKKILLHFRDIRASVCQCQKPLFPLLHPYSEHLRLTNCNMLY